jgi:mannose-6-phosphate isomerase
MVWGGRRLGDSLGKTLSPNLAYGESWDVSDHPLHRSVIAAGPWAGRTLRDAMEREARALLGPAAASHAVFPWLVKFLDANDWLSVQVHPDKDAVRRLWPGEGSKTEAWFILAADPGSRVYAGLGPGMNEGRLRTALQAGTVADCLHGFTPRAGDCIFLPAGTVHAVGGGVLMAEVQQTSDATFRLFDWNRRDVDGKMRQLHVEQALASIHWDQGPVEPVRARGFAELYGRANLSEPQLLVRCHYFTLEYQQSPEPFSWGGEGKLQTVIVLAGSGLLEGPGAAETVAAGQAWVLPAAMPKVRFCPQGLMKFLICTLPSSTVDEGH